VKLIYLACPLTIVSAFLGLIAYYSFLPSDVPHDSAAVESTSAAIESEERFTATLGKIVASTTWFTNFDSRYLRLDWPACTDAEESGADENDSPCDALGCSGSCDAAADNGIESPDDSDLGAQAVRPRSESNKSG